MARVTVFIPVYNAEKFLEKAVDSVLNQTYGDIEVLLVDDSSTDGSMEILQSYKDPRINIYQNEKNMGIPYTRNRGLDLCHTEYMALLDDDDIAVPYRLEHEIKYLDEHPEIHVVGGHQRQIDALGNDLNKQWSVCLNPKYIKAYLMTGNTVVNGSTMFRKDFIDKHGIRYQENSYGAEDYRFWVECSLRGNIANLDKVLLLWRTGHGNETTRAKAENHAERRLYINSIRNYAIKENGFNLSEDQLDVINKVFTANGTIDSNQEMKRLFKALQTMACQANQMKLENAREIITMCRKRFGEKIGKAFYLWEYG